MSDIVDQCAAVWDRKALEAELAQASAKMVEQSARIARLEAALRECEATVVTHHAEDVARTDWSGSGMAQKKARAVATRSGLLMHNIMIIIRAALGDERT